MATRRPCPIQPVATAERRPRHFTGTPPRPGAFPMPDDPEHGWTPTHAARPRGPDPVVKLWTMVRGMELRRAELRERDAGAAELQFFAANDVFLSGRRYSHRALAIIDADAAREALAVSGWTCARCRGARWMCAAHPDHVAGH